MSVEKFLQNYKEKHSDLMDTVDELLDKHTETMEKILAVIDDDRELGANNAATLLHCIIFSLYGPRHL